MLASYQLHLWSPNGVDWVQPDFSTRFAQTLGYELGGSAKDWPTSNVAGDNRGALSFWGFDDEEKQGGCCSTSPFEAGSRGANLPFTLSYGIPGLQPLPVSTTLVGRIVVDKHDKTGDERIRNKCEEDVASWCDARFLTRLEASKRVTNSIPLGGPFSYRLTL